MLRLATLFSGIGAIEEALKKLKIDYNIVFACDNGDRVKVIEDVEKVKEETKDLTFKEKNEYVEEIYNASGEENLMEKSYKANYDIDPRMFFQDVRFVDGSRFLNQIDLLVGGSPCQSFSVNGKRGGFEDTRGTLFYDYARVIKESQPKVFIFENVQGMLTHDDGKTWDTIKNVFYELNYNIRIQVINSKDYGIPQNRIRLFVVGFRKDLKLEKEFKFPEPIKLTTTVKDYLEPNVNYSYYLGKKGFEFVTTAHSRAQVGGDIMRCQKANQQFNWNGDFIFEDYEKVKDNPKILEKAYVGTWNGRKGVIRKFTPRECLRLMGFDDNFKIVVNDVNMYKQAGNSIVVNVLEHILKSIEETGVWNEGC